MNSSKNFRLKGSLEFSGHPQWEAARDLMDQLRTAGYKALLAGGSVRDGLLGITPKDFDIATDAQEEELQRLFPQALPVGRQFGIFIIPYPGFQIEIAGFRKEGEYLDGRRPSEVMPGSPEDDAKRRDFTVNALFYDPEAHEVIDYVGGHKDLLARLIRCVGEPKVRFLEDHLRILRACRFVGQLGFELEAESLQAAQDCRNLIKKVSAERITEEWLKLLRSPHANQALGLSGRVGATSVLFPELDDGAVDLTFFSSSKEAWSDEHLLGFLWEGKARLFFEEHKEMEFSEFSKELELWLASLRLSTAVFSRLARGLFIYHEALVSSKSKGQILAQLLKTQDYEGWLRFWKLSLKQKEARDKLLGLGEELRRLNQVGLTKPLLLGADLIGLGFKPGPRFGELMVQAFERQLEGEWSTKAEALQWLKNVKSE